MIPIRTPSKKVSLDRHQYTSDVAIWSNGESIWAVQLTVIEMAFADQDWDLRKEALFDAVHAANYTMFSQKFGNWMYDVANCVVWTLHDMSNNALFESI